ncbi:hypothetical protein FIBSPDRAFT_886300 [Athelia psychrophila]|uniref:Uncharacterized protein n=1 Tax=Athelia psychrophila TaxID=1759441 RepID=A0A166QZR7_9AGAM|nr:hypothetical protein FIBSPDRAFT_886300 [Fibularhizoctonia sp. CBS 109695]
MNYDGCGIIKFSFEQTHHSGLHSSSFTLNPAANLPNHTHPLLANNWPAYNFRVDYVDDLIMLWEHSVIVRTPKYSEAQELDQIHGYPEPFEMPSWVARLPHQVGYPAGGSLIVDEWKGLALVYCLVVIPMVLDEWFPTLQAQHLKQLEKWDKNETARDKRIKNVQEQNKAPKEKDLKLTPKPEMDKFYWAAQSSLRASLTQKRCFKPTFCVPEVNNHGGGEIETTFCRKFMQNADLRWLITLFLADSASTGLSAEEEGICEAAQMLLVSDSNTCGTVVALSHKMDKQTSDVDKQLSLGDARMTSLDPEHCVVESDRTPPNFLVSHVRSYKHLILNGCHILPSKSLTRANNSIIQVDFDELHYVGQSIKIFAHEQPKVPGYNMLMSVCWFKRIVVDMKNWDLYPELEILFWENAAFLGPSDHGPAHIIPTSLIVSQAVQLIIHKNEHDPPLDDALREDDVPAIINSTSYWVTISPTMVLRAVLDSLSKIVLNSTGQPELARFSVILRKIVLPITVDNTVDKYNSDSRI